MFPLHHGYALRSGGFDEMLSAPHALRPHWEEFVEALSALAPAEMASRWERGQRLISDNGITYHVHGDPQGVERPWRLDPMPLVISAAEGRALAEGLAQRARLFNLILADVYGERRLLREGLLPPGLVFGHPGYLRPCRGIVPPQGLYLHQLGVDLGRLPDGGWRVIGDAVEAPAGCGYALENRQIIGRILAEFFRSSRVQWLAPYFEALRDTLMALSPRRFETPRLVLLTPGSEIETYFEHAYLARQLGCILAESEDLTVRESRLFLKTLDGLQPVDVLVRHTPGVMCDPLDLDSRSGLGIAGLVQAVRAGTVAVANTLGSGVLETPALNAVLPRLARTLLGEDLKLPPVATWWCGDDEQRRHVLANLPRLVIRRSFDAKAPPLFGEALTVAGRQELAERIAAQPQDYLATEPLTLSTAPTWQDGRLQPQPVVLRGFAAALPGGDGGYLALAGGLALAAPARDAAGSALQAGEGGSKDVWVLSDAPPSPARPAQPSVGPVRLVRGGRDLPSRVADNMFWFGRYLERCEDTTRMLRILYAMAEESVADASGGGCAPILTLMAQLGLPPARHGGTLGEAAVALGRMHFDGGVSASLRANTERLLRVAGRVRDRLSLDTWRNVQRLMGQMTGLRPGLAADAGEVLGHLNGLILTLEASSGLVMENMTRGLGWRFLDIGRRVERAGHMIDLLSGTVTTGAAEMPLVLDTLLMVSDSAMTYRSRYASAPQFAPVLDLLLCDESNPRAVAYQFGLLGEHVDRLVAFRDAARIRPEQRLMIFLSGTVRTADIELLSSAEDDGCRWHLGKALEVLRSRLWELSETLTSEYFTHASRQAGLDRGVGT
jgi:uncharacterized circularly permuted ATP-grasp superfamily protein/uncharacterized alpha-E superfamily protein